MATKAAYQPTYVKGGLNATDFSGHERFRKVDLCIPELTQEGKAELSSGKPLQNLLHRTSAQIFIE
jgi:hypothetical protein